jgi:aconitate hydratase 2/2-methylisocitrate dehydratase
MGDGARVFLGSAELAAIVANLGRIPGVEEYFAVYRKIIEPKKAEIYRCLQFDEMEGY